jgi:hypothetical protein
MPFDSFCSTWLLPSDWKARQPSRRVTDCFLHAAGLPKHPPLYHTITSLRRRSSANSGSANSNSGTPMSRHSKSHTSGCPPRGASLQTSLSDHTNGGRPFEVVGPEIAQISPCSSPFALITLASIAPSQLCLQRHHRQSRPGSCRMTGCGIQRACGKESELRINHSAVQILGLWDYAVTHGSTLPFG